jgi:cytoskeletal protein CcmA (bactofilin family)
MFFRKKKLAVNDNRLGATAQAEAAQPTLIAFDASINGNIESDGHVQIDGRIRGHVHAAIVTVTIDGTIEGEAAADEVVVEGHIKGPIRAGHIHLRPGALVEGNLTCISLAIDQGARLFGTIRQEQLAQPADHLFAPEAEPAGFGQPPWDGRPHDGMRPLAAVRPRTTGR